MKRPGNAAWHHGPDTETQEMRILDLWDAGHSMNSIAAQLDTPYRAVSRIIGMYCGTEGQDYAAIRASSRALAAALATYRGPAPQSGERAAA